MKYILEVVTGPEAKKVKGKEEWYPIVDGGKDLIIGDGAYAKFSKQFGNTTNSDTTKTQEKP
jgi:hypothetical protein